MKKVVITNAKIDDVRIGFDRGVFLSIWLFLDYGGTHQGYGGYCFNSPNPDDKFLSDRVVEGPEFGIAVQNIMRTFEVEDFSKLVGQIIRVERIDEWSGEVLAVGHALKDKWFSFQKLWPKE